MKLSQYLLLILVPILNSYAQNTTKRIILIGDAGRIDAEQEVTVSKAVSDAKLYNPQVFYLGDNIYKHGYSLGNQDKKLVTEKILDSQF